MSQQAAATNGAGVVVSSAADEFRDKRKTKKGEVESADVKAKFNLSSDYPINHIACNQTQEYFAVATNIGFEIVQNDSSSTRLKKKSQILNESVCLIEMMYKTNIIVLVLASQKNKVVIWDDHEKKNRTEISFNAGSEIRNIRLRKDMLVVVLEDKVFVFNFETLKLIEQVETCQNMLGLCSLSTAEKPAQKTIVCLHTDKGSLKVLTYGKISK
jgi:hypothetical protein